MKILLYTENEKMISKSGLGKAIKHQMKALEENNIEYTTDPDDDYDIVHINYYGPASYLLAKKAKKLGKKVIYHAHSTEEDFRNSFIEALKSQSLYKSTFAYNVALDAAKAPANEALLYGDEQFREVARNIAKNNPYITKEMVLADFDKLK